MIRLRFLYRSLDLKIQREEVTASLLWRVVCRQREDTSQQNGAGTRWRRKITQSDLGRSEFYHIRFLVQAVYDNLSWPANFHIYDRFETLPYPLSTFFKLLQGFGRWILSLTPWLDRWSNYGIFIDTAIKRMKRRPSR